MVLRLVRKTIFGFRSLWWTTDAIVRFFHSPVLFQPRTPDTPLYWMSFYLHGRSKLAPRRGDVVSSNPLFAPPSVFACCYYFLNLFHFTASSAALIVLRQSIGCGCCFCVYLYRYLSGLEAFVSLFPYLLPWLGNTFTIGTVDPPASTPCHPVG